MVLILKKGASKKQIQDITKKLELKKGISIAKYIGRIKLTEDSLEIQKKLRDEWR